jgi:protein gp37
MSKSTIEWTQVTWNPVTGCDKVSKGCKFCYAEIMSKRLQAMGIEKYKDNFKVREHPKTLLEPHLWSKPRLVFVNSMSDLFHKEVTTTYIKDVFKVMNDTPQHTYQVLTKRAERLLELSPELNWTPNIWMGVSVEDSHVLERVEYLKETGAHIKFLSMEPLLGSVDDLNVNGIDWIIVGGESGPKSRPMKIEWVELIHEKCKTVGVPFFFKQWGNWGPDGVRRSKKANGRLFKGKTYDEMP